MSAIPFVDLAAQRRRLGGRVDAAIARVLEHGHFIMGPEVRRLEADLAAFCGARHAISCANGTEALVLPMMAKGVGPGDAVFCPSFTFAATAEAVALVGAVPVFVDVEPETFGMDAGSLEAAVVTAREAGLKPVAVIPVDLFGQPADYEAVGAVCARHGLWILADGAQSFGAVRAGRRVGTSGLATGTSFFPAKPLGCYGDGGAIFTDDDELAAVLRSLRVHGQGADKYDNVRIGLNGRLDTIQAAVLIEKLSIFREEIEARDIVARRYGEGLAGLSGFVALPVLAENTVSVWAQYTVRIPGRRDAVVARLKDRGIPTMIYYRTPLHHQTAYRSFPAAPGLTVSERLAEEVLSLPMHPYLDAATQGRIIEAVREALLGGGS